MNKLKKNLYIKYMLRTYAEIYCKHDDNLNSRDSPFLSRSLKLMGETGTDLIMKILICPVSLYYAPSPSIFSHYYILIP